MVHIMVKGFFAKSIMKKFVIYWQNAIKVKLKLIEGEGKYNKSYEILKNCISQKCRYLFAQVCIKLNKLIEAEKAIYGDKGLNYSISAPELENEIIFGSAGYYLLGIICEKLVIM